MDAFDRVLKEKLHAMIKDSEVPAQDKELPCRTEYMRRTNAIIDDIKAHLPKWDSKSFATGIWIFDHECNKAKYLVEDLAEEEHVSPRIVIQALQGAAATEGYGILIMAATLMPNIDENGEENDISTEEAQQLMHRLSEDPDTINSVCQGIMLYRETKDGFIDLVLYRVRRDTKQVEQYMAGAFKEHSIVSVAKTIGLKTFGVAPEDRKLFGTRS